MAYTLDTPLGTLLEDPQVKPVIESYVPGLSTSPMLGMIKGLTLNMIVAMPQAAQLGLTKEKAEQLLVEANKYAK